MYVTIYLLFVLFVFFLQVCHRVMDSAMVRLLCDNDRLRLFHPTLAASLSHSLPARPPVAAAMTFTPRSAFASVSFQAETDNSKNFPSERNFTVFKKQRDIFYEVRLGTRHQSLMAKIGSRCLAFMA